MIADFYTYIHIRADDGLVFYVGKGKGNRATSFDGRNPYWHRTEKKHGLVALPRSVGGQNFSRDT